MIIIISLGELAAVLIGFIALGALFNFWGEISVGIAIAICVVIGLILLSVLIALTKTLSLIPYKWIKIPLILGLWFGVATGLLSVTSYTGTDPFRQYEVVTIVNQSSSTDIVDVYYRNYIEENDNSEWIRVPAKKFIKKRIYMVPQGRSNQFLLKPGKYEIKVGRENADTQEKLSDVEMKGTVLEVKKTPMEMLMKMEQDLSAKVGYKGGELFLME